MVLVVEVIALSPWTDPVASRPARQVDPVAPAEVDRYGVNTFLHKEVDRWKKEQTFTLAHDLGVRWVKQQSCGAPSNEQ